MKKIIVLLLLANLSFAQEATEKPHRYLGLGFKLGAFQTSEFYANFYPVNRLFLSVDPIKYLRVDVQWGISNSTNQQTVTYPTGAKANFDLDTKNSILQFGAFGTLTLDDMMLFGGFRYGFNNGSFDYLQSNWNGTNQEYTVLTNEVKGTTLSPVIGAEYRFGNRFSVGAEISYLLLSYKYTYGNPSQLPTESEANLIETSAFFRFFPF